MKSQYFGLMSTVCILVLIASCTEAPRRRRGEDSAGGADGSSNTSAGGSGSGGAITCSDEMQNGLETDVDCGGSCPPCELSQGCQVNTDCASGYCGGGQQCASPSCGNHAIDPGEVDVDCGGSCPGCATGKYCNTHTDCLSLTCINGVCRDPTCTDTLQNQQETATDCGGPCPGCELGQACQEPEDCKTHACEGGLCCQPNACGVCAALPIEICNGQDDDCDGQTDEEPEIGAPPLCPKQAGVCADAVSICQGTAGFTCSDETYAELSDAYEATETTCDTLDNDCDGQIDEGLLNACGFCGPVPAERCNGQDDDCDGQIDELVQCAACGEPLIALPINSLDFYSDPAGGLTLLNEAAFAVAGTTLYRFDGGKLTWAKPYTQTPVNDLIGFPSVVAHQGKLYIAVVQYYSGGVHLIHYKATPDGVMSGPANGGIADNTFGAQAYLASSGSTLGLLYQAEYFGSGDPYLQYATFDDAQGTWSPVFGESFDPYEWSALAYDSNGVGHILYQTFTINSSNNYEENVHHKVVGGSSGLIYDGKIDILNPQLIAGPAGSLHASFSDTAGFAAPFTVYYQARLNDQWGQAEPVPGDARYGAVAITAAGTAAVVTTKTSGNGIGIAYHNGPGNWVTEVIASYPTNSNTLSRPVARTDSWGRIHIFANANKASGGSNAVVYKVHCPVGW